MLQFVIGTAGTGKTTYLINEIEATVKAGDKAILLVPEQFSFQSEKTIYRRLGQAGSANVEVLSFTRLCNNIFREFGGLSGNSLNPTSRILLMSIAISQVRDQLVTYTKQAGGSAFLEASINACSELKTAGVTPIELETFTAEQEDSRLKNKLADLSLIYTAFQALIEKGYSDPEDDIIKTCEILENNNYFKDYHVFIDGFTTFMSGEFLLLNHIVSSAKSVKIALTTDEIKDRTNGTGVFSVVKQTIKRIQTEAENIGVSVLEPVVLTESYRYTNAELTFLGESFLINNNSYKLSTESVKLFTAPDSFSEFRTIGATIKKMVREEGYQYSDFGIIVRSVEDYRQVTQLALNRYEIPYFADEKIDVESSPLYFGIISTISAVETNYAGEAVLMLAKSPIMGLEPEKVAQLENYVYSWQIRGELWKSDFVNNPRGMVEDFTESDYARLAEINETRKSIMEPLIHLEKALKQENGRTFAFGIYNFLIKINCTENLKKYSTNLNDVSAEQFLDLNSQLWDSLIDILDIFGDVLVNVSLERGRLIELFKLAVSSTDVGVIPQMLDQVIVGGADRVRPHQLKVVFVAGVNEGVFPANVSTKGLFSDRERENLNNSGLGISAGGIHQSLLERFYGYFAFTLPSEKLFVSYVDSSLGGEKKLPSIFASQIEITFPNIGDLTLQQEDYIEDKTSALEVLSVEFQQDTPLRATLWQLLSQSDSQIIARMEESAWKPAHKLENTNLATQIFGNNMYLSPSRVERFYRCPFSYFVQDGLRLRKRQKVDFSPLESGSLIHHVLQVMMQKYGGKGLSELSFNQINKEVNVIILGYIEDRITDKDQLPARMEFLFTRLCDTLTRLLVHLGKEFDQSQFSPVAFELEIRDDQPTKPLELFTANGGKVKVSGVVDRVDLMELNGIKYIRVVDYKSGSKQFQLQDVIEGLNLQMLLYLFTIAENGVDSLENVSPAGVLYMPVRETYNSVERSATDEEALRKLQAQWKMGGILIDEREVLEGMEENFCEVFIPVKVNKDESFSKTSPLASIEDMGRLSNLVKKHIVDMANALGDGDIKALPVDDGSYLTCQYCDYRSVCGYEDGDSVKTISRMSHSQALNYLAKEGESHE